MKIQEFYDPQTFTLTFVVFDEKTRDAIVIDPVLDYDSGASQTSTESKADSAKAEPMKAESASAMEGRHVAG